MPKSFSPHTRDGINSAAENTEATRILWTIYACMSVRNLPAILLASYHFSRQKIFEFLHAFRCAIFQVSKQDPEINCRSIAGYPAVSIDFELGTILYFPTKISQVFLMISGITIILFIH